MSAPGRAPWIAFSIVGAGACVDLCRVTTATCVGRALGRHRRRDAGDDLRLEPQHVVRQRDRVLGLAGHDGHHLPEEADPAHRQRLARRPAARSVNVPLSDVLVPMVVPVTRIAAAGTGAWSGSTTRPENALLLSAGNGCEAECRYQERVHPGGTPRPSIHTPHHDCSSCVERVLPPAKATTSKGAGPRGGTRVPSPDAALAMLSARRRPDVGTVGDAAADAASGQPRGRIEETISADERR